MIAKHIICIINELHAAHATRGKHAVSTDSRMRQDSH
ncbi:uncharacterized protein Dvir_GJ27135 [Drosophila virilis]|uniref:Uncharacterized protein n=1 Tax=Drosophila virilis TaxID=7244 RepID=A0A0Q9WLH0_DROVI|nr:uncharacterized protein Dvir_GJ27135 [Drosophila virilis]